MEFTKKILILLVSVFISQCACFAIEQKEIIKVGISNQSFSTYEHENISFVSSGEILVSDLSSDQKALIKQNIITKISVRKGTLEVFSDNKSVISNTIGPLVLTSSDRLGIIELNRKGSPAYYGGQFEIKITKNKKFNVINVLSMQEYLKGVVPNEMPISFGLEALKAQAVAARNYANRDVNSNPNYDVCDSQASQVYYGYNSHKPLADRAVEETLGLYALYNSEPIVTPYFSTSGGITESWENVFGNYNSKFPPRLPYLTSVFDNSDYKVLKTEQDVEEFYSKKPETYDINSPKYRWSVSFEKNELEEILKRTLQEQSKAGNVTPKFDGDLGILKDIKVLKRGDSGKALLLEISTDKGRFEVKKELGIRRVFKKDNKALNSANFFIEKIENNKQGAIFDNDEKEIIYAFTGGGFGHGVGMSQYGAGFMASKGKSYVDILKHYYTGITVGTIPKNVQYQPFDYVYNIDFYFDKKFKAFLKVDNSKKLSELHFSVNDIEFEPSLSLFDARTLFFDITQYLEEGKNQILIKPLSEKDKFKNALIFVEVVE